MRTFILLMVALTTLACLSVGKHPDSHLKCIRVSQVMPKLSEVNPGKIERMDSSYIDFYSFENLSIYRIPYDHEIYNRDTLVSIKREFQYFIIEKDSVYGRNFSPAISVYNQRGHIDTLTSVRKDLDLRLKVMFETMNTKLVGKELVDGKQMEQYTYAAKTNTYDRGELLLGYTDELADIPFHLSGYMDSLKGQKVCFYNMTAYGGPITGTKVTMDTLKVTVKAFEFTPSNPERKLVLNFIEMYRKKKQD